MAPPKPHFNPLALALVKIFSQCLSISSLSAKLLSLPIELVKSTLPIVTPERVFILDKERISSKLS